MRRLAFLLALALAASPTAAAVRATPFGVWVNPHHSVQVQIGQCGDTLCGDVVGASAGAIADAKKAGTPALIGTRVLYDYRPAKAGGWQGTVFVPDMNGRYWSKMTQPSASSLTVSGCLLSGFLCQRQTWARVS